MANGCAFIDKLNAPDEATNNRRIPTLKLVTREEGVRIVRLTFRDGDVLADHAAPTPIVIMGQTGTLQLSVEGTEETEEFTLEPGSAAHIDAHLTHRLTATAGPAMATLLLLA